jgi:hypothetical protein
MEPFRQCGAGQSNPVGSTTRLEYLWRSKGTAFSSISELYEYYKNNGMPGVFSHSTRRRPDASAFAA